MNPAAAPGPQGSYGKLAKRGLVWGFVRDGVRFLVLIPTGMLVARLLSPQESGIAAAAYFVMQLGGRLTQFGLGVSLVRAKTVTDEHLSSVLVMNLVAGGLASALFATVGPFLGGLIGSHEAASLLPIAGLGFLIGAFGSVPGALLSRAMRYREGATSDLLANLVYSVSLVTMAWMGSATGASSTASSWPTPSASSAGHGCRDSCRDSGSRARRRETSFRSGSAST